MLYVIFQFVYTVPECDWSGGDKKRKQENDDLQPPTKRFRHTLFDNPLGTDPVIPGFMPPFRHTLFDNPLGTDPVIPGFMPPQPTIKSIDWNLRVFVGRLPQEARNNVSYFVY